MLSNFPKSGNRASPILLLLPFLRYLKKDWLHYLLIRLAALRKSKFKQVCFVLLSACTIF